MDERPSFCIHTYGCQMNVYDSDLIAGILSDRGYPRAGSLEEADLILVNTCAVREHAERRAIGRLNELTGMKRVRPDLVVGICGCVAQRLGRGAREVVPSIDLVVGPSCYRMLPGLIEDVLRDRMPRYALDLGEGESYDGILTAAGRGVTAFLAIMRGCDNRCSYCIVPYVRGPERSRSRDDILAELRTLAEGGVREITLLGQNVVAYRDGEHRFADLLQAIDDSRLIQRIRFTTSHPRDLDETVIRAVAELESVCEHIHLPMQSGSTSVLERMNRQYTAEHYRALTEELREQVPGIAITTDIIVGFPGETDDDFRKTLEMVNETRFDYAYMFRYSPRPGTPAASFESEVPERVRGERLKQLIELQNGIIRQRNAELVGEEVEVLVEGASHQSDEELIGRTRTNKVVVFGGSRDLIGNFVDVRVAELRGWTPWGYRAQRSDAEESVRTVVTGAGVT
ncbi:hypothetical protein AMJ71_09365 [candidate division TA06 bacterium SM1_40]|uniref:tRNA-2-methylthio-N(6)-dimethylallyladenosine synthase n=1 Tax=candidate division TA06 bacterium SM1_40 TaxID=1703773 RepID=A0A0S8JAM8_UNCT6|nr:MAG: hypothetical protein AMJ71_09365 [candidate division TA06 bacterium SM1_40]